MSSRLILAAGDISSSPILAERLRGKTARELYRCSKGILLTHSVVKPVAYAIAQIPGELTKGVISTAIGQIGEGVIGYVSCSGFVRYLYKIAQPVKLKATARLAYNVACLPITLYSKGMGGTCDILKSLN